MPSQKTQPVWDPNVAVNQAMEARRKAAATNNEQVKPSKPPAFGGIFRRKTA
jgi:hypothetical protein